MKKGALLKPKVCFVQSIYFFFKEGDQVFFITSKYTRSITVYYINYRYLSHIRSPIGLPNFGVIFVVINILSESRILRQIVFDCSVK